MPGPGGGSHGGGFSGGGSRGGGGGFDIVAREGGYLVFLEVKYRSHDTNGLPEEAVDRRKQRVISRVALFYLRRFGYGVSTPVRFDVVAVSGEKDFSVALYQNAFEFCG